MTLLLSKYLPAPFETTGISVPVSLLSLLVRSPILGNYPIAHVVRNFLDNTGSQLTYHGLFTLVSELPPGALVALFRNSHLSVLYKRPRRKVKGQGNSVKSDATTSTPEDANREQQQASSSSITPNPIPAFSSKNPYRDVVQLNEGSSPGDGASQVDALASLSIADKFEEVNVEQKIAEEVPKEEEGKEEEDTSLYSLVTDFVFLQEPSVVWERLEDV